MLTYKNIGASTKTFYGVTFKPGDIKQVKGYINDPAFIRVDKPAYKNEPKPLLIKVEPEVQHKEESKDTKGESKDKKEQSKKSNNTDNKSDEKDTKQD